MKNKKLFIIIGILLVAAFFAGMYGLSEWFKPHQKIENKQGLVISADSLINFYNEDEAAANARFLDKAIEVRGTVAKVGVNSDGQTTVLLASSDPLTSVFCTLRDKGIKVDEGKEIVIKGFCSGKTLDVLLTDCVIVDQEND